jgi:hypothetical protein
MERSRFDIVATDGAMKPIAKYNHSTSVQGDTDECRCDQFGI